MGWKIIRYPTGWKRVSAVLRRAIGRCELCGCKERLTVHHKGIPYPDGRPGDSRDKHDLRLENLQVLCEPCHIEVDRIYPTSPSRQEKLRRRNERKKEKKRVAKEAHRALNVGTGLVLYQTPCMIVQTAMS